MFPQTPHIECVAELVRGRFRPVRAVTIRDQQLTVEEHPDPEPGHGEVLVRVNAAGLNGADMMQLRGSLPGAPWLAPRTSRGSSWPARSQALRSRAPSASARATA